MVMWVYLVLGIVIGLVLILVGYLLWTRNKKKKLKPFTQIPPEVLDDFAKAERRLEESNGEIEPTRILWDIASEKRRTRGTQEVEGTGNQVRTERTSDKPIPIQPMEYKPDSADSTGPVSNGNGDSQVEGRDKPNTRRFRRLD